MIITGFYHVCMVNNWEEVVKEQLQLLQQSDLYTVSNEINVGALGPAVEYLKLQELVKAYPKVKVRYFSLDIEEFEFPTLELLHGHCVRLRETPGHSVYYIHTKGVFDQRGAHWRNYMNYYNITNWREAVKALERGYDMSGVKWMRGNSTFPQHYSGNFFHARAEHIARKPAIDDIRREPMCNIGLRYNAEFWNGMGEPRAHTQCQVLIDHKRTPEYKSESEVGGAGNYQ